MAAEVHVDIFQIGVHHENSHNGSDYTCIFTKFHELIKT